MTRRFRMSTQNYGHGTESFLNTLTAVAGFKNNIEKLEIFWTRCVRVLFGSASESTFILCLDHISGPSSRATRNNTAILLFWPAHPPKVRPRRQFVFGGHSLPEAWRELKIKVVAAVRNLKSHLGLFKNLKTKFYRIFRMILAAAWLRPAKKIQI